MFRPMNTQFFVLVFLLSSFAGLVSCSKDLSRSHAADLISQDKDFTAALDVKVPVGSIWWDWRNLDFLNHAFPIKKLQDSAVLTFRASGKVDGMWNKEYVVELTPHGKDLAKSWILTSEKLPSGGFMGPSSSGLVYSIVIARRKLKELTGVTMDSGGKESTAEFNWEWYPDSNATMFADRIPAGVLKGKAAFQLYDDGWRITQVAMAGGPSF